jgi:membrane protein implicated in regulation of membrane protease activity
MAYILEHTVFGFCWWDLVALIILIVIAVIFIMKYLQMKKLQKDLEDQVSEIYSEGVETEGISTQS